jgi:hypothetical protein
VIKGVVLAAAAVVGALSLLAATGRVDDLRSQVGLKEDPFDAINEALKEPGSERVRQKIAWGSLTREANSICADYQHHSHVVRRTLPRNRSDYVRALRSSVARERMMQAELAALKPPPNYKRPYSKFLEDREVALAALERLQRAAKEQNRKDFALAARTILRRRASIDLHVRSVGMPACLF